MYPIESQRMQLSGVIYGIRVSEIFFVEKALEQKSIYHMIPPMTFNLKNLG